MFIEHFKSIVFSKEIHQLCSKRLFLVLVKNVLAYSIFIYFRMLLMLNDKLNFH